MIERTNLELIGCATGRFVSQRALWLFAWLFDDELELYVMTLGVAPTHRERGIASELLHRLIALAQRRAPNCRALTLDVKVSKFLFKISLKQIAFC